MCVCFARYVSFCTRYFFGGAWVLGDPKFPAKNAWTKRTFIKGLVGTHITRVQTIRIYNQKTAWRFWTFVRKTCVICVVASSVLDVYGINFGRWIWLDIGHTLSNLGIIAWRCLRVQQSARSGKMMEKMLFSYGNARPLLTLLKACGRWGHVFGTSASPGSWTKKTGYVMTHPLPLFMAVSVIYQVKYVTLIRAAVAWGIHGGLNLGR